MNISEVEHKVGLSKKSIRYYEENGLLHPKRNCDNDYRIFSEEDIQRLKIIKFFRELGISMHDLKALANDTKSLQDCLEEQKKKIREQEHIYERVKDMCDQLMECHDSFWDIDITKYFHNMNVLNKEGFTMRSVRVNKRKKIQGAILSSTIFGGFFLFLIGIISYFQFTEENAMPWLVYFFLILLLGFPIVGILYNLIQRIKEINGGEEDEASKY